MISRRNRFIFIAAFLLMACASPAAASAPETPASPRDYVTDLADVVSPEIQARLNAYLQELEQKTTAQVLVLTIQSLEGRSIEEFAFAVKEQWKLGQKGKDNGVLIVVAVQDRKYRLEIGYGLESILPDSQVGTIGREYLVPYFKKGDYGAGIYAATVAVANVIAANESVQITGLPALRQTRSTGKPFGAFQKIIFGIIILVAVILFITHPQQCLLLMLASSIGGGRGGGWSGGDSGFGGGSFGGGGGGSGGGGGASGSW